MECHFCSAPFSHVFYCKAESEQSKEREREEEERVAERPSGGGGGGGGGAAKDVSYLSHHRHGGPANQRPRLLRQFVLFRGRSRNKEPQQPPTFRDTKIAML